MEINAARFLMTGNTLEVWYVDAAHWQYYSLARAAGRFIISGGGDRANHQPAADGYKKLPDALAMVERYVAGLRPDTAAAGVDTPAVATSPAHSSWPVQFDWWRRSGMGCALDVDRFCKAGNRLVYWPSNWHRFSHVIRIAPLIFLGWENNRFYVKANAYHRRYHIQFITVSSAQAMARAARARADREALVFGADHVSKRRKTHAAGR